jgi:small subunit ribosomal protein S9
MANETEDNATATENTATATGTQAGSALPELTLGSGAPADGSEHPAEERAVRGKIDKFGVAMGTGRRKTAVARVRIKRGNGALTINGRSLEDYCRVERDRMNVEAPLRATDTHGKVDIWVRVEGGGPTGQAGAIVLGIARALQTMDPTLHARLSEGGYLTRDGRMVERKKYGYKKARKSFQFSKR